MKIDFDFCWRAWISGYDAIITPKSFLYHKISRTFRNDGLKRFLTEKNKLRTLLKNYMVFSLIKILKGYFFNITNEILKYRYYKKMKKYFKNL